MALLSRDGALPAVDMLPYDDDSPAVRRRHDQHPVTDTP